jgi:hypothetical protein
MNLKKIISKKLVILMMKTKNTILTSLLDKILNINITPKWLCPNTSRSRFYLDLYAVLNFKIIIICLNNFF